MYGKAGINALPADCRDGTNRSDAAYIRIKIPTTLVIKTAPLNGLKINIIPHIVVIRDIIIVVFHKEFSLFFISILYCNFAALLIIIIIPTIKGIILAIA